MKLNLLRTVCSGTGSLSTENLILPIEKQLLQVEREAKTGTQSERQSISFRAKQKGHGIQR